MASLIDALLGGVGGTDALDTYLGSLGVDPLSHAQVDYSQQALPRYGGGSQGQPGGAMSLSQAATAPGIAEVAQPPAQAPAQVNNPDDVEIAADPWKPRHTSTLGKVADFLMGRPLFEQITERKNMEDAFKNFQDDPEKTIRHVARFNPEAAWKMYNVWQDNETAAQREKMAAQQLTMNRGAGLLSTANSSNWSAVRSRYYKYMQANGMDPDEMGIGLSETYDPDEVNANREAAMSAAQQFTYEETHDYHGQRLNQFQQDFLSKDARRRAQTAQGQARVEQGEARLGLSRQAYEEKRRHNQAVEQGKTDIPVQTKYGTGLVRKGVLHIVVNGVEHQYAPVSQGNGKVQWRLVHQEGDPNFNYDGPDNEDDDDEDDNN